jgi:acetoin utilization protein AcuC
MEAALFFSPAQAELSYGAGHPFQVERLADVMRMCAALGYLGDRKPMRPIAASRLELLRFHSADYLDALARADELSPHERLVWGVGTEDCPAFPGLWESCLLAAGGSLSAARWMLEGLRSGIARQAFHPAGGLHHAHADRASGFCYVNDGVLAIQEFVDAGYRVLYVDIDAHHGDGVQEAFYESDRVLTISVHQDGRTLFPGTGFPNEIGRGAGTGYAVNIPLLPGATDEDYDAVRETLLEPLRAWFLPDVIVTEIGVDSMRDDPLTLLDWTLAGLERFLIWSQRSGTPWLALGGGGYRRWNVIRGWTLVWARMIGAELPDRRPAEDAQGSLPESWPVRLWDEPPPRAICDAGMRRAHLDEVRSTLGELVFSRMGR